MSSLVQCSACIAISPLAAVCLWTPCLALSPLIFLSPYPAILLSSLFHHVAFSPPVLTLTVSSPRVFTLSTPTHGVNRKTQLSFFGSQLTSGLMNHWIIALCGDVCESLWVCIYEHWSMCFYLFLSHFIINHLDIMWVLRAQAWQFLL